MSESKFKTMRHIETIRNYLNLCIRELMHRQERHDQSKLEELEVETFDKFTPKLRNCTYGSDEYKGYLKEMDVALQNHYANNRHHPEHFKGVYVCNGCFTKWPFGKEPERCPQCGYTKYQLEKNGLLGMNLIDVLEMIVDWKCSGMRHADGCLYKSIEINQKRFGYSDELKQIFINTAHWINSQDVYHKAGES